MLAKIQSQLGAFVLPPFLIFLLVVGVVGVIVGASLLARSDAVWRLAGTLNRWVSFRKLMRPLEVPHDSWAVIERNRRILALAMTVASIYTLMILWGVDLHAAGVNLGKRYGVSAAGADWLLHSFVLFVSAGNVLAVIAAWALAFKPDLVVKIDRIASRWVSTRQMMRPADAMHSGLDQLVASWPRTAGMLIAVFSLVEVICVVRVLR